MRIRPPATREQVRALRAELARILEPDAALDIARQWIDGGIEPATAVCTVQTVHPDRFVARMRLHSSAGDERGYALKVYADDFGERMWALARTLADQEPSNHIGLCLPRQYIRQARTLVFPWVEGTRLSEIVDERKPGLLRRAAALASEFHRTSVTDVPTLAPGMVVAETVARCDYVRARWPSLETTVVPLVRRMEELVTELDPIRPALVHGDLAAGQFLWTGERMILLDLDTVCHGDPAYDVGHFLGQLERRCVLDPNLPAHSKTWLECFRQAYPASSLGVSWRNVSFYQGVTLLRKTFTLCFRDPVAGPGLAMRLAERARAAFETVESR